MTHLTGPRIELGGHFSLVVRKINTNEVVRKLEFKNLILNQGLDRMATTSAGNMILSVCVLGTGTSTPLVTDTQLQSFSASTSTYQSSSYLQQSSTLPYYAENSGTFRFAAGTLNGNYSEIGVGWGTTSGQLFSRALIVDGGGNPTTLTVLSDEFLDVTYILRNYLPSVDGSFSVNITGVGTRNVTTRPAVFNSSRTEQANNSYVTGSNYTLTIAGATSAHGIYHNTGWSITRVANNTGVAYLKITNAGRIVENLYICPTTRTTLNTVTADTNTYSPVGTRDASTDVTLSSPAYVAGSFQQTTTVTFGLNANNGTFQHILVGFAGCGVWQFLFDQPITKLNTQTFQLTFVVSWGRYTP